VSPRSYRNDTLFLSFLRSSFETRVGFRSAPVDTEVATFADGKGGSGMTKAIGDALREDVGTIETFGQVARCERFPPDTGAGE